MSATPRPDALRDGSECSLEQDGQLGTASRPTLSRRSLLKTASAATLGGGLAATHSALGEPAVKHGRIQQSVVQWCFKDTWDVPQTIAVAKQLGCRSVELIPPKYWDQLKEAGLVCAIASSHSFRTGMNNPDHWDMCFTKLRTTIDACAHYGFPNVITFTGYREKLTDEEGMKNCVAGYKKIIKYAEEKKVNLCLEMLNTRDDTHPMKGHPGYQGDSTEYCIDIIRQVGSPRMKLLFDVYHVQIMDGDVIRRLRQYRNEIGHIHTAGNPGRGELNDAQEINYPAVMKTLLEIKYDGFVGQEFIPTGDAMAGLRAAVSLCDV